MRALKRFHHCSITKMVKKTVSFLSSIPAPCSKYHNRAKVARKNSPPVVRIPRIMDLVMMNASLLRGFSSITSREGGSEASAIAASVSMMRFTHSICVMVSGISVPMKPPKSASNRAATLTMSWKKMKRWMFLYSERPHITACTMLLNESSISVMSLACLATLVPEPNESPTWARFKAGASLVPSPVTATTSPCCCNRLTRRCLSVGRARDITFNSLMRSSASSSLSAANSAPVIQFSRLGSSPH